MSDMKTLLYGFVAIMIGIPLLIIIANDTYKNANALDVTNENVTVAGARATLANNNISTWTDFGAAWSNNTQDVGTGGINVSSNGTVAVNTSFPAGTYLVNYSYFDDLYVYSASSRTIVNLIVIFFAVGLLATGTILITKGFQGMV